MILVVVETDDLDMSLEALTFARELGQRSDGCRPGRGRRCDRRRARAARATRCPGCRRRAIVRTTSGSALRAGSLGGCRRGRRRVRDANVVLASGTPRGNEILAHVAARLDVAMAANVVQAEGGEPFLVTRQVVGGAALEQMPLADRVAVLSVAGHACDPQPAAAPVEAELVGFSPKLSDRDLVARVVRVEASEQADTGALTSARVVIGAGRGAGGPDGFDELIELTELLDGALGVSRVVTSLGWRPHSEQVGQTGSRIAPELYIPCGISGAIQHWAGCQSAKAILAINTDAEAPMVTKATYAVIGDLHEIVPAINAELRQRLGR